jgi:hypothetical protein
MTASCRACRIVQAYRFDMPIGAMMKNRPSLPVFALLVRVLMMPNPAQDFSP